MLPASGKPGRRGTEWRSAHALTVDSHLGRCHLLWGGPISRRRIATDSTSLVLGSAVNGLAAYAFVAVGTRAYGAEVFAPVSVIWTFWALSVAAFTFPVQHWIIRVVEVEGGDASVRRTLPRLAAVAGVVAMLMLAVAFPLRQRLFGTPSLWWPVLVPIVSVGSAVVGYGRGVLASRRRFVASGIAIGAENLIRLALGAAIVALGGSVEWFGAALAGGVLIVLFWPSTFRLDAAPAPRHRVLEFMAGLGGGILLAQVALNAPPAVVAGIGGEAAAVTGVFATLALFRAPYLVALGFATQLTGPLTSLVLQRAEARLARIRRGVLVVGGAGGVLGAAGGWVAGPWIVDLIFGAGISPQRGIVAAISAGSLMAVGALGLILVLLARGATTAIFRSWLVALAVAVAVLLVPGAAATTRVVSAFVVTEVVALAAMALADRNLAAAGTAVPSGG